MQCACGERHWGLHGAAGLLVVRRDDAGRPAAVILQHRAQWSHHGGTWGIPGGARQPGESARDAALREALEEAGVAADDVAVFGERVLTHPDWTYTTVLADERPGADARPRATDAESLDVRWTPLDEVAGLALHPAFAAAWPALEAHVRGRS